MKKILSLLLLLSMLVVSVTACGTVASQSPSASTVTPGESTDDFSAIPPIKEEELMESVAINAYIAGRAFDIANRDNGAGSVLSKAVNTNQAEYLAYVAELEAKGFAKYTANKIGNNLFTTLVTKTQIVNLSYFENTKEVFVTVDSREMFSLPGLKTENLYQAKSTPDQSFTMLAMGQNTYDTGLGFIYKLADGSFFIIDGGIDSDGNKSDDDPQNHLKWVKATLRELADDPDNIVVSTWLITHIHNDHVGLFKDMAQDEDARNTITVERVIYNQPSDADMTAGGITHRINWMSDSFEAWNIQNVVKAHPGQVFYIKDLTLTIYATHEIVDAEYLFDHNNACIVSTVGFKHKTALMLADSSEYENLKIAEVYKNDLYAICDILQLAHHGYGDGSNGKHTRPDPVYQLVEPDIVLWSNSTYRLHAGGKIFEQEFNQKFFAPGIDNHVAGEQNTTFTDLSSWENPDRWVPKGWE
ncbi:MAG: hypothetical protein IKM08_01575 [Clostridia bacterium]|nr:hypothetical protein [Clostridia bacterium]